MEETTIQLTAQEAFDRVCRHLKKQGACSVDENGKCLYRGPEGRMCAIGALIPDEVYKPEWDQPGHSGGYTVARLIRDNNLFPGSIRHLLQELQDAHDQQRKQESPKFAPDLKKIAKDFGLEWKNGR